MQDFDDLGFYLKPGLNIRATSYILFVDSHVDKKAGVLADGSQKAPSTANIFLLTPQSC